ncbi:MAG: transposase [Anaerocolumna sp.]
MSKKDDTNLPESMKHYIKDTDHNEVLYHNRSEDTERKINTVLKDAALLITACSGNYDDSSEYQLLIRVIGEQAKIDGNGNFTLKEKSSGMNSEIIQNPADPDATYRKKAGAEYRGYIANVVEQADHEKSLVIDYQVEKNIYSGSQFLKDYIKRQPDINEETILTTDGGYCGNENAKLAASKNIKLVTTDLKGANVRYLWAEFQFNKEGTELIRCAGGFTPKSNVYDTNTQKCKASFPLQTCQRCPHFEQCNPVIHKRVATIKLAQRTAYHAQQQRFIQTDEFKALARYKNGVETIPAALRK